MSFVHLSVCNTVHCGAQGHCRWLELYYRVASRQLHINFFDTFAAKKRTKQTDDNSASGHRLRAM